MAEATSELFLKCDALQMTNQRLVRVSNKAVSSASVRIIGRGPYGEKIVSCENLYLTEEEIKKVRSGNYKGVLLFNSAENVGCDSLTRRFELYLKSSIFNY